MFRDAFTAKKASAFRASGDGFAGAVIEAALMKQILHGVERFSSSEVNSSLNCVDPA
jgi:hypothetical protein